MGRMRTSHDKSTSRVSPEVDSQYSMGISAPKTWPKVQRVYPYLALRQPDGSLTVTDTDPTSNIRMRVRGREVTRENKYDQP